MRLILSLILLLGLSSPLWAAVEVGLAGHTVTRIDEVYLREGVCYLAVDDLLAAVALSGRWDSVRHLYRIDSRAGEATLAPGSRNLRLGDSAIPLAHAPRFIDGRLRVSEEFSEQLSRLTGKDVTFRNLSPGEGERGSKLPPPLPLAPTKP